MAPHGSPPPTNPVLSAYEAFVRDTPLVTRYTLTILGISWLVSFVASPHYAIGNVPLFTIYSFEIYRIFFSPLIATSIISLIFAYLSFTQNAKVLEFSIGSASFGYLMLLVGVITNITFLAFTYLLFIITSEHSWLVQNASGIWIILFGLVAIECAQTPLDHKRRLFFCEVPTLYYPVALAAIFSLIDFQLAHFISIVVGYAYGYGYLDILKVSSTRCESWEDGFLRSMTSRPGWVVAHSALGSNAWQLPVHTGGRSGENHPESAGTWSPASFFQGQRTDASGVGENDRAVNLGASGSENKSGRGSSTGFPTTGGRSLGGHRQRAQDARAARVAALEGKQNANDASSSS